jgi:hypothetical protein
MHLHEAASQYAIYAHNVHLCLGPRGVKITVISSADEESTTIVPWVKIQEPAANPIILEAESLIDRYPGLREKLWENFTTPTLEGDA